jgi:hypothetical protein
MEFYSSMKKNDFFSLAVKWMKLENIILSEVRFRKPKSKYFYSYAEYITDTNVAIL